MTEYSEEQKHWVWMASIPEITPKVFYNILKLFGSASGFFDAAYTDSGLLNELPEKISSAAMKAASKQYAAEALCSLSSKGIHVVTRLSEHYPKLLLEIDYPPPVLYVKGSLEDISDAISIVGTRRPTRHALSFTESIAADLGEAGFTVVSGMAYGIDTAAHKGALSADSKTIAVLGCGVDVIYPRENEELYHSIINCGAVISELAPATEPLAANFPARNRIVTGLSKGTLIVESEQKGGTAISANLAISQKRDVFAVPGMSPMSFLPNILIKQGAVPVTCADDILCFYGLIGKNNVITDEHSEIQLDFLQRHIYNLLLKGDLSIERIAESIEYSLSEASAALTIMELSGLVKRLPGGKYGI